MHCDRPNHSLFGSTVHCLTVTDMYCMYVCEKFQVDKYTIYQLITNNQTTATRNQTNEDLILEVKILLSNLLILVVNK